MNTRLSNTLAFGSYSQSRRTIDAVFGQLAAVGYNEQQIHRLLRSAGLPENAEYNPEFSLSSVFELGLLKNVIKKLLADDKDVGQFAFEFGMAIALRHFGLFGLMLIHAPTVLEAALEILRQPELAWGHSQIRSVRQQDQVRFIFEMAYYPIKLNPDLATSLANYCVARDLAATVALIAQVSENRVKPTRISLACNGKHGITSNSQHINCTIETGADAYLIEYNSADLLTVPPHANAHFYRRYKQSAEAGAKFLYQTKTLSQRVTHLLWAYSPPPTRSEIAGIIGLSERTLTRRLSAEKQSFQQLQKLVNIERAKNYLRYSKHPISEISELMGYAEPAAFSRAFTSWVGQSPNAWRKIQLGE